MTSRHRGRLGSTLLFFFACTIFIRPAYAQIIPPSRSVTWQGNVGVEGGIPSRTTLRNCVAEYGAHADGTNTASNINACLSNIGSGEVAYLPAGTYVVASSVSIPANKTLRDAGVDSTVLLSNSDFTPIVRIGSGSTSASGIDIASGYTKDSAQLTFLTSGAISGTSVGDFVRIDEWATREIVDTKVEVHYNDGGVRHGEDSLWDVLG
jgi:hypothetical protein